MSSNLYLMFLTNVTQEHDPFIQASKRTPVDLAAWATSLMERSNRQSHLVSQPEIDAALLNGSSTEDAAASAKTPTADVSQRMQSLNISGASNGDQKTPAAFPVRTSSYGQSTDFGATSGWDPNGQSRPPPSGALPPIPTDHGRDAHRF